MTGIHLSVGASDAELDRTLSAELTALNVAAIGADDQQSLSI